MSFTSFRQLQSFKQSTGTQLGARFYYRSDISAKKMVEKAKLCVDAPRLKTMDLTRPLTDGFGVNWSTFGRTWEKRERGNTNWEFHHCLSTSGIPVLTKVTKLDTKSKECVTISIAMTYQCSVNNITNKQLNKQAAEQVHATKWLDHKRIQLVYTHCELHQLQSFKQSTGTQLGANLKSTRVWWALQSPLLATVV